MVFEDEEEEKGSDVVTQQSGALCERAVSFFLGQTRPKSQPCLVFVSVDFQLSQPF